MAPVAGGARHQGHHAQLRDEPDAAVDPARPPARAVRLQGPPAGHGLPAVARRLDPAVGRRAQGPRVDLAVLQARRRSVAEVRGVDRPHREHHGAAPDGDAAAPRLEEGRRHQGRRAARLAAPQGDRRADRRRHHAAVHDERHRSAPALVRERGVHRAAVGERDHRHVVRARRARHRVRVDASLGRGHRRRRDRELGATPRAAWARSATRAPPRRRRSAPRSARTPASSACSSATAARRGVALAGGEELLRAARRHRDPPEDHVPGADRALGASGRRSSRTSRTGGRARAP